MQKIGKDQLKYLYNVDGTLVTRRQARDMLYRDGINPIQLTDELICKTMFGDNTPFTFLSKSSSTLDGYDDHVILLHRAVDIYNMCLESRFSSVHKMLKGIRNYTIYDIYSRKDEWKSFNKIYRDPEKSLEEQMLLTFVRSLYVKVDSTISKQFLADYIEEYGNDYPSKDYHPDSDDEGIAKRFASYYNHQDWTSFHAAQYPRPRNTFSSFECKKIYDQKYFLRELQKCENDQMINSYAKDAVITSLTMISSYYDDEQISDIIEIINRVASIPSDSSSLNMANFLPRGNCVSQHKGKVGRFVCAGNDILDIALYPLMCVIKHMENMLPNFMPKYSEMGESNGDINKRIADRFTNCEVKATYQGQTYGVIYDRGACGVDSSSATEKINGHYMFKSWRLDFDYLDDEIKSKTGLSDEYLDLAERLLCTTPFIIVNDNKVYYMFTNGTSQGLMVSWDLLNYGNMKASCLGALDFARDFLQCEDEPAYTIAFKTCLKSMYDGDDGEHPVEIQPFYCDRLQSVSLPGVVNKDKSGDEDSQGYVEFASSYVNTGYVVPKVLSNIIITSCLKDLSDPGVLNVNLRMPYYKKQLMLLKKSGILSYFDSMYNIGKFPILIDDKDTISKALLFHKACELIRYNNLNYYLTRSVQLEPFEDATYGITHKCAPNIRALQLITTNSSMSFEAAYVQSTRQALKLCYQNISSSIQELDEELNSIKELLFVEGCELSEIITDLMDDDDRILREVMASKALSVSLKDIEIDRSVIESIYNVTNYGFEHFVISIKLRTALRRC